MSLCLLEELAFVPESWKDVLSSALTESPGLQGALDQDHERYGGELEVFPPRGMVFNAFCHFELTKLKVVILGQDVYHTKGHGMGLAFSVPDGIRCAPSLRNIIKEVERSCGAKRSSTDLTDWAQQGVLLLNTALTVREGCPGSHISAWKSFTTRVMQHITTNSRNVVYMLWGSHAHSYANMIDNDNNLVLKSIHPSPLASRSGSFVGNGHFEKANEYLQKFDRSPIAWA